jgi:hypothetical protein
MIGSVFGGLQVFLFLLATFGPKLLLLLKLGYKLLLKTFICVEGFYFFLNKYLNFLISFFKLCSLHHFFSAYYHLLNNKKSEILKKN